MYVVRHAGERVRTLLVRTEITGRGNTNCIVICQLGESHVSQT